MAAYRRVDDLTVTCGLTACTPGSAPRPTLGVEYGKPLPFTFYCAAGSTAVMYTGGVVHVLDSGQSVELDCVFAMTGFTLFDNPVVWQKTQRHERTAVNVLAAIESPFLDTGRFHAAFHVLEPSRFRTSLAISSQYMIYDTICARHFCCLVSFSLFYCLWFHPADNKLAIRKIKNCFFKLRHGGRPPS